MNDTMIRTPSELDRFLPGFTDVKTIVEVGCHEMEDTTYLRAVFPAATIIALEPDPRNVEFILSRGLPEACRIDFFPWALGAIDGPLPFYLSTNLQNNPEKEWTASSSLRKPSPLTAAHREMALAGAIPHVFADEPVSVPCFRLDTLMDDFSRISGKPMPVDLIWCDAQGAEDLILEGARETLKNVRWIFMEHNTCGIYEGAPTADKLQAMLPGWKTLEVWPYDILLERIIT